MACICTISAREQARFWGMDGHFACLQPHVFFTKVYEKAFTPIFIPVDGLGICLAAHGQPNVSPKP
jgi:hypothetical protein